MLHTATALSSQLCIGAPFECMQNVRNAPVLCLEAPKTPCIIYYSYRTNWA